MSDFGQHLVGSHRPHSNLLFYYVLSSFVLGPLFFVLLVPRFFRYRTLHYTFDDEGVTMRWGVLFRREISLTYARIQDIHLASNLVERWLGLARVEVQTAAGTAKAEMTIEGFPDFETLRDFLYTRMQGAKGSPRRRPDHRPEAPSAEVVEALRETAAELRALRQELASRGGG